MARLAWFSPMPPARSGVATVSADLLPALAHEHAIDVFVDESLARSRPGLRSAHDFVWAHRLAPYDLTVYQVGNSSSHDYLYPYLFRFPGLAVLHDVRLHHARAAALLRRRLPRAYREELAWNHPDVDPDRAELAVAGFDSQLYYALPMTRLIARVSRAVGVHTAAARQELTEATPHAHVELIRLGHGTPLSDHETHAASARARARFGIPATAVVFGCYGGLTPEKRLPQILEAFAATLRYTPAAWLLLAGGTASHYDLLADITRAGVANRVVVTGYLDSERDLTDCIAACDVGLALRWPTAGEVSGPWLRCLALAKPTIVLDLAHLAELPSLDPRTWEPHDGNRGEAAICVAADVLDEDHSLRRAMRLLAADAALRAQLGVAAADYWRRTHAPAVMADDYRGAIGRALSRLPPAAALPAHLTDDGLRLVRATADRFGLPSPLG